MRLRERLMPLVSRRGTLDGWGYAKHIAIAYAVCFGFFVGGALSLGVLWIFIEQEAPDSLMVLAPLIFMPFAIAAFGAWWTIVICATVRFVRYVRAETCGRAALSRGVSYQPNPPVTDGPCDCT
jgi:uncharacterized YccA/Bax inhibitor family protein